MKDAEFEEEYVDSLYHASIEKTEVFGVRFVLSQKLWEMRENTAGTLKDVSIFIGCKQSTRRL